MLRIRRFEEKCAELYNADKIRGSLHLYIGEEAVAVAAMQALKADDGVPAIYREHGRALARGIPMRTLIAEMYGKYEGCSHGRREEEERSFDTGAARSADSERVSAGHR